MTNRDQELINELLNVLRLTEGWMSEGTPDVESGSSLSGDNARTHPYELGDGAAQSIISAVDHLHCFRMALTGTGDDVLRLHTYAPYTLLRGAIENAAIAVWTLAPDNRRERLIRHLWHEMTSLRKLEGLLTAAGEQVGRDTEGRKKKLLDLADVHAIERSAIDNKRLTSSMIVKAASQATGLTDGPLELAFLYWRLCSAITHGDRGYLPLFELETIGPAGPGRSSVRVTAKTESVLGGSRGATAMVLAARHIFENRATRHH